MRFIFTCGGTAGHINPALAIAGRIRELDEASEILFIGADGNMETELVPMAGFEIRTVRITNIQRGLSGKQIIHNLKTIKNIYHSIGKSKDIIKEFCPDVVVGTGGYVCYPVIKAAAALGIPTAIHESNAVPGLTTKALEGCVDKILVGFEESKANYKNPEKVLITGTPVRGEFFQSCGADTKAELGLTPEKPLVISVWGSLGATKMNGIILELAERALKKPFFNLIHSVGKRDYKELAKKVGDSKLLEYKNAGIDIREYIYDMPRVLAAADLVLCRAGASILSELTVSGKPAVLVPSPNVTNNHQEKNARVLSENGAARLLLEREITAPGLLGLISELLNDNKMLESMSRKMKEMAVPDSANKIVSVILGLGDNSGLKDSK